MDGEATFRPSGAVSQLIASHIQLATPANDVWEQAPRPRPRSMEEIKPRKPSPPGLSLIDRVFGKWPGDETSEELLAALERIS